MADRQVQALANFPALGLGYGDIGTITPEEAETFKDAFDRDPPLLAFVTGSNKKKPAPEAEQPELDTPDPG